MTMTLNDYLLHAASWFAAIIVGIAGFVGIVVLVGMMIDSRAEYDQQHDACLKQATNGYEIQKCH